VIADLVGQKRALIFDLFHTLTSLESTGAGTGTAAMLGISREAWTRQLLESSEDRLVGRERDPVAMIRRMAHAVDPTIPEETIRRATESRIARFAYALANVPPANRTVLEQLRAGGKRLGLISNADVSEVAAWEKSPIAGLFHSVVFSCHAGCAKPQPEIYGICLRELAVLPEDVLYVGDGGSEELRGAREAGMTTAMVTADIGDLTARALEARRQYADCVIDRLASLLKKV
jgi:putative hydrolase of the HAD superfamily